MINDGSKAAFQQYFEKVMAPIPNYLATQPPGYLKIGTSGTIYSERIRQAEGFLRLLWGYAGYYKSNPVDETFHNLLNGIKAGTDPDSDSYWGDIDNVNQLMVEMAPLAVFILLNEAAVKAELSETETNNLIHWLDQINQYDTARNNWLFFRVLVNVCFDQCFQIDRSQQIKADLAILETFYLGNGWYYDGVVQQRDYYISFAIHYYSLLYAYFCRETDLENAAKFRGRALQFAETFRYWFDSEGRGIPFGRSLTYRFAQSSFWSALLLVVDEAPQAVKQEAKAHLFNNLDQWLSRDIFSTDGYLKVGYFYENLVMAEEYNGPGSPYWALKAFILLATEDDTIWALTPEEREKESLKLLPEAQMLIQTAPNGKQVQAYPAGQYVESHSQGEAKYSKFVYSTEFGFSVAKGVHGWDKGAFDNVLSVSEGDDFFRIRTRATNFAVHEEYTYHLWQPWKDVIIKSFIVPFENSHLRIHQVNSGRQLTLRDGGFAIPYDGQVSIETGTADLTLSAEELYSQVVSCDQKMSAAISNRIANQNVYFPCCQILYLTAAMSAGSQVYINVFSGRKDSAWNVPQLKFTEGRLLIGTDNQKEIILKEWQE